jgi:hypothetical protein
VPRVLDGMMDIFEHIEQVALWQALFEQGAR